MRRTGTIRALRMAAMLVALSWAPSAHATDYPLDCNPPAPATPPPVCGLCPNSLHFESGTRHMRYCRNKSLSSENPGVTRAIILIHGSGSKAREYFDTVNQLATLLGMQNRLIIMAPNFLEDDQNNANGTVLSIHDLDANYYYWTGGWRYGNPSLNSNGSMRSFAVIDSMVDTLIDNNEDLEHIAVIGHSAGAQFVHRYAAASPAVAEAGARGVTMSFGAFAAGKYLYLNATRPELTAGCADFNKYPLGLSSLNSYMAATGAADIRHRMLVRHTYYVVGSADTDPNNDACADTQGTSRVDSSNNYEAHLMSYCVPVYGTAVCNSFFFRKADAFREVPGGHDHVPLFWDPWGQHVIFHAR
jgi:pimeloyl-ACP methyl ester carboxylesterase